MTRARASFVAFFLALLLLAPGGAASAHDQLTGSDPEDGATVEAPEELVLTFSGQIGELGTLVEVTGPDGESVVDGDPVVAGLDVRQALVDGLDAGDYDVVWRVTSEDGHPIAGELGFTVEEGDEAAEDTAEETTTEVTAEEPTEEATGEETTGEPTAAEATDDATEDAAEDVAADAAEDEDEGSGGLPVWGWVLVGLAAVALAALLARTWSRGRE